MKKITILLILLTVSLGYSQTVLEDFEIALGAGAVAYSPENGAPLEGSATQVANPDMSAPNTSANVMEVITGASHEPWQNGQLFFNLGSGIDADLTDANPTGNKIINVDVWHSGSPTFILAKIVDGPSGGGPAGSEVATDAPHTGSGWETLSFDFSIPKDCGPNYCGPAFEVYSRILFFPLWNGTGFDGTMGASPVLTTYYDNIIKEGTLLGVDDNKILEFSAYPNPTQGNWNVKTKNQAITSIKVFDMLGKNVISLSPNSREAIIDGSSLSRGIYFAQIKTDTGVNSVKLVKQ